MIVYVDTRKIDVVTAKSGIFVYRELGVRKSFCVKHLGQVRLYISRPAMMLLSETFLGYRPPFSKHAPLLSPSGDVLPQVTYGAHADDCPRSNGGF